MKKYAIIFLFLALPFSSSAINQDLYLQDTRTWGQWDVMVSSVDITTRVCGMFAYSEMTVVFKDTLSQNASDSIELTCNFFLPPESVVDSLSLWIKGKPEPAYLLDKWRAWQVYSTIVNRRRDPAFLTVSGDRYNLRIFPFKPREARKVKINFSSPLLAVGGKLALRMPLDFVAHSSHAPTNVVWEVLWSDLYNLSDVDFAGPGEMTVAKINKGGKPELIASAENSKISSTLQCTFRNALFDSSGAIAEMAKDGDSATYFTAQLNIDKMLDIKDKGRKKVLFLFNGVQTSNTVQYRAEEECLYNVNSECHYYYDYYLTNNYNPTSVTSDLEALGKFIGENLCQGDSFNVILNDGTITSFNNGGLVEASSNNCLRAASFLLTAPSKDSKTADCKSFADLLKAALAKENLANYMEIVIIDRTDIRPYPPDSTFLKIDPVPGGGVQKRYYQNSVKNGIDVNALTQQLLLQLPSGTTIYALIYPYNYYQNFRLYDQLTRITNGAIISIYDKEYCFRSLSDLMIQKLYPANLTISTGGGANIYDVCGYSPSTIPLYKPLLITGRINGAADSVTVSLKGNFNGKDYAVTRGIKLTTSCSLPAQRQLWASKKVAGLNKENSQMAQKEAADISFSHHILTEYTALLALEPGMDSLLTQQERNQSNGIVDRQGKVDSGLCRASIVNFKVSVSRSGILVAVPEFQKMHGQSFSIQVYDIRGRLVATVPAKAILSKGEFLVSSKVLSRGTYIVRLFIGKTVIAKRISLIW